MAVAAGFGTAQYNAIRIGHRGSIFNRLIDINSVLPYPYSYADPGDQLTKTMNDIDGPAIGSSAFVGGGTVTTGADQDQIVWIHNTGVADPTTAICGVWWKGDGVGTITLRFCNPTVGTITPTPGLSAIPVLIGVA